MTDLLHDISTITTIPKEALAKLVQKAEWCICNIVDENRLANNLISQIDLGFGSLLIKDGDDDIEYKFIPSTQLEEGIRSTLVDKKNPLKLKLEETLVDKILNTYKTII